MYEYYVGMTYQKNALFMCKDTVLPALYFQKTQISLFFGRDKKFSTSEGAVCLTTDPISGMHILPVMAQLRVVNEIITPTRVTYIEVQIICAYIYNYIYIIYILYYIILYIIKYIILYIYYIIYN